MCLLIWLDTLIEIQEVTVGSTNPEITMLQYKNQPNQKSYLSSGTSAITKRSVAICSPHSGFGCCLLTYIEYHSSSRILPTSIKKQTKLRYLSV